VGPNALLNNLNTSVLITKDLLLQVLRGHDLQSQKISTFHNLIIQEIGVQLKSARPLDPLHTYYRSQDGYGHEFLAREGKTYHIQTVFGALELGFGSPIQLNMVRAPHLERSSYSTEYIPPSWFFRMVISLSMATPFGQW
jgi:hypothetical protein